VPYSGWSVFQTVDTECGPGDAVVASAWLRAQDVPASGQLCLWGLSGASLPLSCAAYSVDATAWQQVQVVLNPSTAQSAVRFQLYPTPGATTRFDSVSLQP
jgi:hypothetical protein